MTDILPPLQFAVLTLIDGKMPGYRIREGLADKFKVLRSLASFYQLMARLEGDGMVKGWYESSVIDRQPIKERVYSRTAKGTARLKIAREFYSA